MLLVIGTLADEVIELVCARATAMGVPWRLFDLAAFPTRCRFDVRLVDGVATGRAVGPDWQVDLDDLTGVFHRAAPGWIVPVELPEGARATAAAECWSAIQAIVDTLRCPVANRSAGGWFNHSKPRQAQVMRAVPGPIRVPATLVTNEPAAARRFIAASAEGVIYKSLSARRSIVRRFTAEDEARLDRLRAGPVQFQALVPGDDVRVHVVDDAVFAARIQSDVVDYRYAHREGGTAVMSATTLPAAVADHCRRLARRHDLLLAGIDLKQTPAGEYYALEVNPMPGFIGYERGAGLPISEAVVASLSGRVDRSQHEGGRRARLIHQRGRSAERRHQARYAPLGAHRA